MVAERIRFLPYSHHPRTTCMRVEIYGCPWTGKRVSSSHPFRRHDWMNLHFGSVCSLGGLVGYTATKSQHHLVDWAENLDDISYDGQQQQEGVHTTGAAGLGQLTDGIVTDNRTSPNGTFFGKFIFK